MRYSKVDSTKLNTEELPKKAMSPAALFRLAERVGSVGIVFEYVWVYAEGCMLKVWMSFFIYGVVVCK
jgi:hypothetical protein